MVMAAANELLLPALLAMDVYRALGRRAKQHVGPERRVCNS
jgi:hypothetical protein